MDPLLSVRLFGAFSLQEGDAPSRPLGSTRIQALVAWLACAPQPSAARQVLAEVLWPEAADSQARNNLRQLLHQLRQAWPGHARWIVADSHALTWQGAWARVDVLEFERAFAGAQASWQRGDREQAAVALRMAAGLYTGPFLPACTDEWVATRRERLRRAGVQVLERLSRVLEEQHDLPGAIERATALVAVDPLRERSYLHLIRLHGLNRDRAAAIRVYEQCEEVLRHELDTAPGPELRDVFARLTRPAAPAAHTASARAEIIGPPLIGRAAEWRTIRDALERADDATAELVLITGEAGLGKTRLGEEALAWADARGGATARARAYEAEGRLALAPVTAWLRSPAIRTALAYDEAQGLLWRMLALLDQEPDSPARAETELRVQLMLAAALRVSAGWASPRLEPLHERIVLLTERVGDLERRATALVTLVFFRIVRGDLQSVGVLLEDMHRAVTASGEAVPHVMGTAALIGYHAHQGRFLQAEEMYERELFSYSPDLHTPLVALMGADFGVLQRAWSSHALWAMGRAADAEERLAEAVTLAETLAHPFSQALALSYRAMLHAFEYDAARVRAAAAAAALEIAERHRVIYYHAWAALLLAWAAAWGGPERSGSGVGSRVDRYVLRHRRPHTAAVLLLAARVSVPEEWEAAGSAR
jgi:DNA-binding SARP family transcriptional activator